MFEMSLGGMARHGFFQNLHAPIQVRLRFHFPVHAGHVGRQRLPQSLAHIEAHGLEQRMVRILSQKAIADGSSRREVAVGDLLARFFIAGLNGVALRANLVVEVLIRSGQIAFHRRFRPLAVYVDHAFDLAERRSDVALLPSLLGLIVEFALARARLGLGLFATFDFAP